MRISEVPCELYTLLPGPLSTQSMVAVRVTLFLKSHVAKLHHTTEIVRAALLRHGLLHTKSEAPTNCYPQQLLGGSWSSSCPHRDILDPLNLPAPVSYLMPNNLADTVTGPML